MERHFCDRCHQPAEPARYIYHGWYIDSMLKSEFCGPCMREFMEWYSNWRDMTAAPTQPQKEA